MAEHHGQAVCVCVCVCLCNGNSPGKLLLSTRCMREDEDGDLSGACGFMDVISPNYGKYIDIHL